MNQKGFTLIELLAVITIMGILLLVGVIAITKIIENTRRDAFANLAQSYIDAVRAEVITGNIKCTRDFGESWINVNEIPNNYHCYFNIQTNYNITAKPEKWTQQIVQKTIQQTIDIMEQGGKSPWGKSDVVGTVRFYKKTVDKSGNKEVEWHYLIRLRDTAKHGTPGTNFIKDHNITRKSIVTSGSSATVSSGNGDSSPPYLCYLS